MKRSLYFDYAATTPVDTDVVDAMMGYLSNDGAFGNPASTAHIYGWQAAEAVDTARQQVADLINADIREVIFTSGATESNNLAIKGVAENYQSRGKHLITVTTEHKSVLDCYAYLESQGFSVTYLKPNSDGLVSTEQLEQAMTDETILFSLMHVNNETGVMHDLAAFGEITRARNVFFHVDAAQSAGKLNIDCKTMKIDLLSISGHKLYAPKGIGALYVSKQPQVELATQIHGGGHERGMRSGTLATHQIVALGKACEKAQALMPSEQQRIAQLRDQLWQGVAHLPDVRRNGSTQSVSANHLNICFAGIDGETLLLSLRQLALSSGSACNSESLKPSYVLTAMGLSDADADSSLRFSLGRFTTEAEVEQAIEHVCTIYQRLKVAV